MVRSNSIISSCDIDFLIFHHSYWIKRSNFPKFKRGQNAVEKFWISNDEAQILKFNKSCQLQNFNCLSESFVGVIAWTNLSLQDINLGRVFNFRCGCVLPACTSFITTELSNLKWITWPKLRWDSILSAFALSIHSTFLKLLL